MAAWRFFQGVRSEWRWYRIAGSGSVLAESEQAYASLRACMADAARAGFDGHAFAVHTHQDWRGKREPLASGPGDPARHPIDDSHGSDPPHAEGSRDTQDNAPA